MLSGSLKPSLLFSTFYFQPTPKQDLILGRMTLLDSHRMTLTMLFTTICLIDIITSLGIRKCEVSYPSLGNNLTIMGNLSTIKVH